MKRVSTAFAAAALMLAAIVAILLLPPSGNEVGGASLIDDDDAELASRVDIVDGVPAVRLERELQVRSGIETRAARAVTHRAETRAFGEVVDIQPLLELRSEHSWTGSQLTIAEAALGASEREYERLRILHQEAANVSARQFQEAEAKWAGDRARVAAAERQLRDLREEMLQAWGARLTGWALDDGSQIFERLVSRKEVLLLVTLRARDALPDDTRSIRVGRSADRSDDAEAQLISPAPRTDPAFQGETWFFHTAAGKLRTGMRLDAWVPLAHESVSGVSVPPAAIIWYGGKPWVYVRLDAERFARRAIAAYRETSDGWFVSGTVTPEEQVVVRGAQMLLSEEFRWQIPEEDRD